MRNKNFNYSFYFNRAITDLWFIVTIVIAFYLLYILINYKVDISSWSTSGTKVENSSFFNFNNYAADILLSILGYAAYFIPFALFILSWQMLKDNELYGEFIFWKLFAIAMGSVALSCIFSLNIDHKINELAVTGGGVIGQKISVLLLPIYNLKIINFIYIVVFIIAITILLGIFWLDIAHKIGFFIYSLFNRKEKGHFINEYEKTFKQPKIKQEKLKERLKANPDLNLLNPEQFFSETDKEIAPPSYLDSNADIYKSNYIDNFEEKINLEQNEIVPQYDENTTFKNNIESSEILEFSTKSSWKEFKNSISANSVGNEFNKPEQITIAESYHPEIKSQEINKLIPKDEIIKQENLAKKELKLNLSDVGLGFKNEIPKSSPSAFNNENFVQKSASPVFSSSQNIDLPSLDLLQNNPPNRAFYSDSALSDMAKTIEEALRNYRLQVNVVGVSQGPVVTQFELQPAAGIKSSQIANLDKDLARLLSVQSVRVVEVIPGKPYIGLEIPNAQSSIVYLRQLLESPEYKTAKSPLSLVLGVNISGEPVVVNLAKMPHLLVAGTTGSGKSVGINVMLVSMLYKASPAELRLILIDPKMLEMSMYRDIPHLLMPVITDMRAAESALRWAVTEMDRRYSLMAETGFTGIEEYNKKALEKLPFIVVVIDELADLMMVAGKKVEELIMRIAQKARAAGIHLILATQRPSVDVITGLIKANIPTRIAFQVSSKVDSRTIIETNGAEALLGNGDMLYMPSGSPQALRVHGAYITNDELRNLTDYLRHSGNAHYVSINDNEENLTLASQEPDDGEADILYPQARELVLQTGKTSTVWLQKKLQIDYKRASSLIEALRREGIIP